MRIDKRQYEAPPSGVEGALAGFAVADGAAETYRFLQDVVLEVPYTQFLGRLKVQSFERIRLLALCDEFEEIEEEEKRRMIRGLDPAIYRARPEFEEMRELLVAAAHRLASETTPAQLMQRVGLRSGKMLDRIARSPMSDSREAAAAGAEIFERVIPKQSREKTQILTVVNFSEESARTLFRAAQEVNAQIEPPAFEEKEK